MFVGPVHEESAGSGPALEVVRQEASLPADGPVDELKRAAEVVVLVLLAAPGRRCVVPLFGVDFENLDLAGERDCLKTV